MYLHLGYVLASLLSQMIPLIVVAWKHTQEDGMCARIQLPIIVADL